MADIEANRDADEIVAVTEPAALELAPITSKAASVSNRPVISKETDPFLVTFQTPHDAENPLDWPSGRKWMVTDVLSATGFNRIMVSTIMAPALSSIASDLNMNPTESAMSLSIYLLATAFGPLAIAPLSEVYGRQVVMHGSNIWFLAWNIACGFAKTKGTLIASRFMAGFGASAIYALAGGVLGDVWRPEQRGSSLSVYLLIPLLGAAVGPIIGGFIAGRTTWRWIFWSTSIFQGVMIAVAFFSFPESYGPVILQRRARRFRKQTGDPRYTTEVERRHGERSAWAVLGRTMTRPLRLLAYHPLIQASALLSGFDYGILYVVLSTFSTLWIKKYGESVEISGLHYIACSFGELFASQLGGRLMDRLYKRRAAHANLQPEARMPLMIPGLVLAWSGALLYGWTAQYKVYWPVVDIGVFVMMFGLQLAGMPIVAYIIDVYSEHASSAMAARQFSCSLMAFLFPLFAPSMYEHLGYGWSNSVLALAGLILMSAIPAYIWKFGPKLRASAPAVY